MTDLFSIKVKLAKLVEDMLNGKVSAQYILDQWGEECSCNFTDKDIDAIIHQLQHYANDSDIRTKDEKYEAYFRQEFELYIKILLSEVKPPVLIYDKKIRIFETVLAACEYLNYSLKDTNRITAFDANGNYLQTDSTEMQTMYFVHRQSKLPVPESFRKELEKFVKSRIHKNKDKSRLKNDKFFSDMSINELITFIIKQKNESEKR
ncbi:hypothetical protein L21SP3_02275 [Sedimentisphaera cyanobacteriorum]|uniref:Uncharacterized protein n=1 Tax=Sedimentisphaera cyanobacteriorum TaxID=1940790 RepID=A0A1Q2HT16_9BACT|nr:hypothetical protein [Sedimentisphaera cyanobacteriorum]AQQ10443.1 hypothetical protein L21SP3_02275 [Sedimentisphaera cyanobacteriorum]